MSEIERHPLWYATYLFEIKTMADAPTGLFAVVGKDRYRVVKVCWCKWFSSGWQEAFGSMIVMDGKLVLAEQDGDFVRIEDSP